MRLTRACRLLFVMTVAGLLLNCATTNTTKGGSKYSMKIIYALDLQKIVTGEYSVILIPVRNTVITFQGEDPHNVGDNDAFLTRIDDMELKYVEVNLDKFPFGMSNPPDEGCIVIIPSGKHKLNYEYADYEFVSGKYYGTTYKTEFNNDFPDEHYYYISRSSLVEMTGIDVSIKIPSGFMTDKNISLNDLISFVKTDIEKKKKDLSNK